MIFRCYSIIYELAYFFSGGLSYFIPKINRFLQQRSTIEASIKAFSKKANHDIFWFHCASMGEFEQIKPLLEAIENELPRTQKIVTFFSESGYAIHKNSHLADLVTYLPLDRKKDMMSFIDHIQPDALFLVKYEFWPNLIQCCVRKKIRLYSISSTFRKEQLFFKRFTLGMKSLLQQVDYFFVLNKDSKEQLKNIHINQVEIIGDTRIDRVLNTAKNLNKHPQLDHFIDKNRCFIAGSTWPEDHQLFSSLPQLCQQTKWIIAPHKVDPSSIKKIENELTVPYTKWSTYEKSKDQNKRVLLLDCIGVLASAYSYANAAYVGGAMGKTGLHNILEATAFGIPVIIGRNYKRYPEANDLIKLGGVKSVTSAQEFELFYNTLKEKPLLEQQMGEINKTYLESNKGATSKIIYFLKTHYNK